VRLLLAAPLAPFLKLNFALNFLLIL